MLGKRWAYLLEGPYLGAYRWRNIISRINLQFLLPQPGNETTCLCFALFNLWNYIYKYFIYVPE